VLRSIDLDEDEATSSREMAQQCHQGGETGRARWLEAEADNFDALTRVLPRRFDRFFISSSQDSDKLVSRHPGLRPEVVENAVVIPKTPPRRDDGRTIVFVGSFGYGPNVAACLWFAQQVWPIVRAAAPTGRVRLIGRDPPRTILELARIDGIQVVGPVDDVADAYTGATLAIAPLHAGTGTRIKIIEAAAFEVPIVSTSLAACGLRLEAPEALWIGDDAAAFAAAVVNALANPEERQRRAKVALRVVQTHHDRAKVIAGLADRFREMLAD
jgi:glycosyltransferase involved in cell wall biosynthesis